MKAALETIFKHLLAAYGPQHWWPADDPFEVMLGAILTQNTNWGNVEKAIANLEQAGAVTAENIAAMERAVLEQLIRPAGFFRQKAERLHRLARFVIRAGGIGAMGKTPTDTLRQQLLEIHGVGPETADSILLYGFNRPVFVIDAYTRRIFSRLGLCSPSSSYDELQNLFMNHLPGDPTLFNEYHALIVAHAKQHCRSRPLCNPCPLADVCLYSN